MINLIVHMMLMLVLLLISLGCTDTKTAFKNDFSKHNAGTSSAGKNITSYDEIPVYIKTYLNSLEGGKYLIADPGKSWSAGCMHSKDLPCRQLISASLTNTAFVMEYWQGGIATQKNIIKLNLDGNSVVGHELK